MSLTTPEGMTDIMMKRASGKIACSECSRTKRKCDRKLPACSPCVLRNCADICPNGTLPQTLPRKKKLAADSPALANRIMQLEDALAILQSSISSEPHSLLKDDLRQIKYGKTIPAAPDEPPTNGLAEALGMLTISPHGESKYFGPSAGPESLLHVGAELLNDQPFPADDLFKLDEKFLFLPQSRTIDDSYQHLLQLLPPKPRAWALCETYIQQACLKEQFVERDELVNDFLVPIYNRRDPARATTTEQDPSFTAHKLAVLFLVFAIGARVDLTIRYDNEEADTYFQLGRTALSLHPILNSPEVATVQALLLLSFCHLQGGRRYDVDVACMLAAIAVKSAESIGLHRESPQWNLDDKTLHRRRYIWWEAFSFDTILSFNLGRPPTMRPSYVDCKYPVDNDAYTAENGETEMGPDRWRWAFAREVLAWALEKTSMPNCPYSTVLEADRKIRDFPIPTRFKVSTSAFSKEDDGNTIFYMKRHFPTHVVLLSTLHIHRTFFTQIMLYHASEPLGSPYATSFVASYKAASGLIGMYVKHLTRAPELMMRYWSIWSALLATAMVVGSIVVRCPNLPIAPKAYMELGVVITLFERGCEESPRARGGLVILRKLMTRATDVFSHRHESRPSSSHEKDLGDELELFGGQTKVLVSNLLSQNRRRFRPSTVHSVATSAEPPPIAVPVVQEDAMFQFLQDLSNTQMSNAMTNTFSAEFMDALMDDAPVQEQPQEQVGWDNQTSLSPEWLAFMEQAGFLDAASASYL